MSKSNQRPTTLIKDLPKELAFKVVMSGLLLVTIFFFTTVIDSFNAPKAWILDISAAWLLGYLIYDLSRRELAEGEKKALLFFGAFIGSMLIALIFTSYFYTGFFGVYGRRTGFLSYFSLVVFALAAMRVFRLTNLIRSDFVILSIGSVTSIYGLAQHFGIDFVHWNNPYNPVISTLGNPDFASAVLGIMAVLAFGIGINSVRRVPTRVWGVFIFLTSESAIIFSSSLQGLLISLLGVGIIVLVWVYQRHRVAGHALLGLGVITGISGILGMLQVGPLTKYLFKVSVTYRGDYWRAGINMFLHHPWFGVGLDRYGESYRRYRDLTTTLRRGPGTVSNAAHNVFIQLAATGGVFVIISYVALTIFIGWRGFIALKRSRGASQLAVATVVAAWVAYLAQSFISIDNLGVAIWGWVLGGIVIGISISPAGNSQDPQSEGKKAEESKKLAENKKAISAARKGFSPELSNVLSGVIAIAMLVLLIPAMLGDKVIQRTTTLQLPTTSQQIPAFLTTVEQQLHTLFVDPTSVLIVSSKIASARLFDQSEEILKNMLKQDKNNYQFLTTLAEIYEQSNSSAKAIPLRKEMTQLDPYNTQNWLQYATDLKASGQTELLPTIIKTIEGIDPKGVDSQKAHSLLK